MATRGPVSTIQRSDIVPLRQRPQLGDGRCRRPLRALRLVNVLALLMRTARGQRPSRTWRTAPKGLADDHVIVKYTRSKVQARAKLPRRMWMLPAAPRPQPVFEHTQRQHEAGRCRSGPVRSRVRLLSTGPCGRQVGDPSTWTMVAVGDLAGHSPLARPARTAPPAPPRGSGPASRFQLYEVDELHACLRRTSRHRSRMPPWASPPAV